MARIVAVLVLLVAVAGWVPKLAAAQDVTCADYDAWEWAQLVLETDPRQHAVLDSDGDGIACPDLPRGVGFAPAIWTDTIPENAQEAEIFRIIDGDTLEVLIDGVTNRVRIYRADTPGTQNELHCGGPEATACAGYALSFNDNPSVVYLEKDVTEVDRYGRELAYVWFVVDGKPYLLNQVLITNGWAEDVDRGDRKYDEQLQEAAAFAQEHALGVYAICGGFGIPGNPPAPTPAPLLPTEPAAQQPVQPPVEQQPARPAGECDPSYPGVCIPPIGVSGDLDCGDISYRRFSVVPPDPHNFDGTMTGWAARVAEVVPTD